MTELTKKYNSYFDEFEMFLHPNVVQGFRKIHNEILKEEIAAAKTFKPSREWLELKDDIDRIKNFHEPAVRPLMLKSLLKKIEALPDEKWR